MTSAGDRQEEEYLNPAGGVVGKAFAAVPPEVQQMLHVKPSKTPERIRQVISWAAALDPEVLRAHRRYNKDLSTLADIRGASLHERDRIAHQFAQQYRHRAAITGAVTALPGGLWALVGMGADVQLTAIYAVRMAAKVAQSYGYDTTTYEEQARMADVLALAAGIDSMRGIGNWLTREGMTQLLPDLLPRVLAKLSLELTAEQAAKWIGRIIPGVSAVVGGAVDYAFLRAAGERAIAYYHNRALNERQGLPGPAETLALPAGTVEANVSPSQIIDADVAPANVAAPAAVTAAQAAPSIAAPQPAPSAEAIAPALPVTPTPAAPSPQPAEPAAKPARRRRPLALYLTVFLVFLMVATTVACVALGSIITSALQSIGH
jgi:hypothetical protein